MLSSPPELQLPMTMTRQIKRAAASRRRERRQGMGLRTALVRRRIMAIAKSPAIGGPKPVVPKNEAPVAPAELDVAAVVRVRVVLTAAAPGVAPAGENAAVHLLGSPAQLKVTAESNEPC